MCETAQQILLCPWYINKSKNQSIMWLFRLYLVENHQKIIRDKLVSLFATIYVICLRIANFSNAILKKEILHLLFNKRPCG